MHRSFAEMLRDAGLSDVTIDEVGNVIARRRGAGRRPALALIAHLDAVIPADTNMRVRIEGDTYRAPGIGDNSRGFVYLLALARAMNAASLRTRGDIPFVGSVRDEGLCVLRSADSGTLEALNLALHSAATAGLAEESDRRTDGPLLQLELRRIGQRPAGAVGTETSLIRTTSAAMSLFGVTPEY